MLWVAYSFAGILGLNRSLNMEVDNDCLQGLLLSPVSRGDLYLGKVAGNLIFTRPRRAGDSSVLHHPEQPGVRQDSSVDRRDHPAGNAGLCCDRNNALADFGPDAE